MTRRLKIVHLSLAVVLAISFLSLLFPMGTFADESAGVVMSTPFPSVVAAKGKQLTFPMEIVNQSQTWQQLDLQIADGPEDWGAALMDRGLQVRKVNLAPGKSQYVDFQAKPPTEAKAQDYGFSVKALRESGSLASQLKLDVKLQDKVTSGLTVSSQYPSLSGQVGNAFSYKVDVANNADTDRDVNFSSSAPEGWRVDFKPAYDTKLVSTIRVKTASTQGVDIDVTPPQKAEPGEYKVTVTAASGADRSEVSLKAIVVGTSKLAVSTPTGDLSAKATVDSISKVAITVRNTGTGPLKNVTLSSTKPDQWEVTFDPATIDELPAAQSKEVSVSLKPAAKALAGDYMVTVSASAQQAANQTASDSKDLRVMVDTPTVWGWVAVAIVVIVLGGLAGLVGRMSRR